MAVWMKFIGTGAVIGAASLLGVRAALLLEQAYQELVGLERLLMLLKGELKYSHTVLSQICSRVSRDAKEPYRSWLSQMGTRLECRDGPRISVIWRECAEECLNASCLPEKELAELAGLGELLEAGDLETQLSQLAGYQERLRMSARNMRAELREKKKLCCCLGIAGGILVSVLLA